MDSVSVGPVIAAGNKDNKDTTTCWGIEISKQVSVSGSLCFGLKRLVEAILGVLDVGA